MGYGLDTEKHPEKRWGKVILYSGDTRGKLQEAFFRWFEGTGVMFTSCASGEQLRLQWGTHNSGQQGNPGQGNVHTLALKEDGTLGAMMHEVGHVLGMAHENDRPDCREQFYSAEGEGSHLMFGLEQAEAAHKKKTYKMYGDPNLGQTIMQYPAKHYLLATKPTAVDFGIAAAINGW